MNKKILLIITGSIAAYKSLELIRLLKKAKYEVTCVLTQSAKKFVTPMSVASLSENNVYDDLFSLKDESEMGHIRLSRESNLVLVAPASANIIAKMANGLADDLASTILMASDKDIAFAPAMNHLMWNNKALERNLKLLHEDGKKIIEPETGELACGEEGKGRMAEPENILKFVEDYFANA